MRVNYLMLAVAVLELGAAGEAVVVNQNWKTAALYALWSAGSIVAALL